MEAATARSTRISILWLNIFLLLTSAAIVAHSGGDAECVYTVYIRTGSILKAGTDSIISLSLSNQYGETLSIPDLESWGGIMDPGHNYFERGNIDIFSGRGHCLSADAPVCAMNLTSDGSGDHHGWYTNYAEVTSTGAHISCAQTLFTVEQWLARDASPYVLTAIRDYCPYTGDVPSGRDGHQLSSSSAI